MGSFCFNYRTLFCLFSLALGIHPWYALDAVLELRNAHLKHFRSSIFQRSWIKIPLTIMGRSAFKLHKLSVPRTGPSV